MLLCFSSYTSLHFFCQCWVFRTISLVLWVWAVCVPACYMGSTVHSNHHWLRTLRFLPGLCCHQRFWDEHHLPGPVRAFLQTADPVVGLLAHEHCAKFIHKVNSSCAQLLQRLILSNFLSFAKDMGVMGHVMVFWICISLRATSLPIPSYTS